MGLLKDVLNREELQELTLMVGSRKALQTYLGMERREFEALWKLHNLLSPTDLVRSLTRDQILSSLIDLGSTAKVSERYGVSESFMKGVIGAAKPKATIALSTALLERYQSIRLTARMTGYTEGQVRKWVKEAKCEHLMKYDFSDHNNAKGRRAETHWASLEGDKVLEDCNVTQGSQHPWDYVHTEYGKVNVKSSKAYRYTAKTRKAHPFYWKLSCTGLENADTCACVLMDGQSRHVLHVFNIPAAEVLAVASSTVKIQILKGRYVLQGSKQAD